MTLRRRMLLALAAVALWTSPARATDPPADAVFINGRVFTADAHSSVRQAFAVRGDRFVAVGTSAAVRKLAGPDTRVVDLKGRFVSPGLGDAHFHSEGGGPGVDLSKVRSLAELLDTVGRAASQAPADAVIVSNFDWHEAQLREQRLPTAAELDRAAPDRPVVLVRGGHSYILNSAALQKWNITPQTPSPAGGAISRDAAGQLTGELIDAAKSLVALPPPPAVSMADVLATQKAVNPFGITSVRIPGFYKGDLRAAHRLMRQAADEGRLTLRYTVYLPGFGVRSADDARRLVEQWGAKPGDGDAWVRLDGVKLGVDGGFEGGHLSQPYAEPYGLGGTYSGVQLIAPERLKEVVLALQQLGWRPTTHAVGDAALDEVLDAYEAANRAAPIVGRRWTIEHAFLARPDHIRRMRALGVAVSVQDHLFVAAPALAKYWGRPRAEQVTPLKSLMGSGLLVAGGTDAPVIPFNPFWELYHFLSRDTISAGVFGPQERVAERRRLLELVTINHARLIGQAAERGSIEPGKLADFAVLTDDFLTASPARVRDMKALATYVGGREVYRDSRF